MATLAPPQPLVEVPLSLFGGTQAELSPPDCPEGLSPDNQDVAFLPGSLDWRPCLHKIIASPASNAAILYQKSYVQPNGDVLTLFLDANGILWQEDVTNNPGVQAQIGTVSPGLYAQSVSAFGREYIAFSDLLHGQGVPLQYDGTNLDRVTQDGPGAGPTIANFVPPSATIAAPGAATVNIVGSPNGILGGDIVIINRTLYYDSILVVTAAPHGLSAGGQVVIAGSTSTPNINGTRTVLAVDSATQFEIAFTIKQSSFVPGGGGTIASPGNAGTSISRQSNVATAITSAAHGFQAGWQVQISGEANTNIGGGIASIARDGNGNVTVTTTTPHGLVQNATIAILGVTNPDTTYNGTFPVATVVSPTVFTYVQSGTVTTSGAGTGNVQDIWNTTAFIQAVPDTVTFTYQQIGPNNNTSGGGTATILGQITPGVHGCVVTFLTRNGALTQPSPPVYFSANGGQQAALSQLPTGPANVVARVLAFTGAGGANYFTLTATPQVSGIITGTSLLIPDNTSTSAIIDFSDTTLFAGIAIDQVGNDLFAQRVLGPVLGFFAYGSRLACWGDYNKVENLLNMGLDGGWAPALVTPTQPLGWTDVPVGTFPLQHLGSQVTGGAWAGGFAFVTTSTTRAGGVPMITQPAYQDASGTPILLPNTSYLVRMWLKAAAPIGGSIVLDIFSATSGVLATGTIALSGVSVTGQFFTAAMSGPMPATIPSDTVIRVYVNATNVNGGQFVFDELELLYAQNPFNNSLSHWSYVLNPEGIASTTGDLGPQDDPAPLRCFSTQRGTAMLTTAQGRHNFQPNDGEPDTWQINELSRSVGSMSLRGADPGQFGTGDAAEDWDVVADPKGLYLFAGGDHWKVSQEYQKYWDQINKAAEQAMWVKNDPNKRRIYVGVPTGSNTTPNLILVLDYRELDTSTQIAGAAPLHITLSGLMKSSDLTRKWTRWNLAMNTGEILVRPGNDLEFCVGGNLGNFYSFDAAKYTDDDYGAMSPYYDTYGFVNHDQEQQLQLGSGRKVARTMQMFATGLGFVTFTPFVDSLQNPLPASSVRQLTSNADQGTALASDLEWATWIRGQRIFYRIQTTPLPGTTDVHLSLQKMVVGLSVDGVKRRTSWL